MTRRDVCTACHQPFLVEIVGDERSKPKETDELACPHCGEVFVEHSRGIPFTSAMAPENEAEWARRQKSTNDFHSKVEAFTDLADSDHTPAGSGRRASFPTVDRSARPLVIQVDGRVLGK
jgi:hypothetical protein